MTGRLQTSAGYAYPGSEAETDALETRMDPYKLSREQLIVSLFSSFDWTFALDYGCGVGRYFGVFEEISRSRDFVRRLTALDPDPERVAEARRMAQEINQRAARLSIEVREGAQAAMQALPGEQKFDLILCAQVLGHVETQVCNGIVELLLSRLSANGSALFLVPFSSALPDADQDVYFAADLTRIDTPDRHRVPLNRDGFDKLVRHPKPNLLPVRSFRVQALGMRGLADMPCPIDSRPAFLSDIDFDRFQVTVQAYTAHTFAAEPGAVAYGDMLVRVGSR